jgi:hypothetical protein
LTQSCCALALRGIFDAASAVAHGSAADGRGDDDGDDDGAEDAAAEPGDGSVDGTWTTTPTAGARGDPGFGSDVDDGSEYCEESAASVVAGP